jgi:excisionase family DNA binding protein
VEAGAVLLVAFTSAARSVTDTKSAALAHEHGRGPTPQRETMSKKSIDLMSVEEVAELLGVGRNVVYDRVHRGRLPGVVYWGRRMLFRRSDVQRHIRIEAPIPTVETTSPKAEAPLPKLEARAAKLVAVEEATVPTLEEFWPMFIAGHCVANRQKPSGIEGKEGAFRTWLRPRLGEKRLDEIGPADIVALKVALAERSAKTANNVLTALSACLKFAGPEGLRRSEGLGIIKQVPRIRLLPVDPDDEPESSMPPRSWTLASTCWCFSGGAPAYVAAR